MAARVGRLYMERRMSNQTDEHTELDGSYDFLAVYAILLQTRSCLLRRSGVNLITEIG